MFAYQEFDPCSTKDKKSMGHELLDAETFKCKSSTAGEKVERQIQGQSQGAATSVHSI
jgi:hypothetical protein